MSITKYYYNEYNEITGNALKHDVLNVAWKSYLMSCLYFRRVFT